jgi:predicted SAM-dependent methyltransferase
MRAVRQLLRKVESRLDPQRQSRQVFWYVAHHFVLRDRKIAAQYILRSQIRKLHLGCGEYLLPGWLNMDYRPLCRETLYIDARQPFFFPDETFDYIFSEHMIEHISHGGGAKMLTECHRILKKGGRIRISTPDLAFLINLYRPDKSAVQREYIDWANQTFVKGSSGKNEVFVINNFMRAWGHTFVYDENTLRTAMSRVGFTDITKHDLQNSDHDALENLENLTRIPKAFLEIETMILEGTKAR